MVRRTLRCLALAALAASAWSPALAQRGSNSGAGTLAVDDTRELDCSSCVLMMRGSSRVPGMGSPMAIGLPDLPSLTSAMTTTGLIDPAARESLGLGPRDWPKAVRIEVTPAGVQAVKLSVCVDPKDLKKPEPAATLMRELIKRAKAVVSQSVEPRRQEAKGRLDELERRRAELRASVESLRTRMRKANVPSSRDVMGNQRQQLESALAAKRPRLQAIKESLKRLDAQGDELGNALKGLVAAREALVAGLEKAAEQAKASPLEILRARADLAETRVRAAEAQRMPRLTPGLNIREEQLSLQVEIDTLEAQIKALPPSGDEVGSMVDAQSLSTELFRLKNELNQLEPQYQQAKREYEALATTPTLVVLDGQTK
ncbi:hypothetical protein [Aquisphaera insulae]|uniref:hypothetical protein n=1 Tax=Aquisphaera insulae TaxID=2712864 RepID=UPI0013EC2697|nr:hypothetical protein [Aquisphaera insulae]